MKHSNAKPSKIRADKGRKFYNRSMKLLWLEKNSSEMYSIHIEGKPVLLMKDLLEL